MTALARCYATGRDIERWDFIAYVLLLKARAAGASVEADIDKVEGSLSEVARDVALRWARRSGADAIP